MKILLEIDTANVEAARSTLQEAETLLSRVEAVPTAETLPLTETLPFAAAPVPAAPVADAVLPVPAAPVADAVPPVPAAPVADAVPPEVDSEGRPWDSRIHSGSRTLLKKTKEWKTKRGLDKTFLAQVNAELDARMGGTPPVPAAPVADAVPPVPAAPVADAVPPVPAAPVADAVPPVPAAPVAEPITFVELMSKVTAAGVSVDQVNAVAQSLGLASAAMVAAPANSALIPEMMLALGLE